MFKNAKLIYFAIGIVICGALIVVVLSLNHNVADYQSDFYNRILDLYNSNKTFADAFGGAYVDSNGIMHILFTETTDELKAKTEAVAENEKFIIGDARFSYTEIMDVIDLVNMELAQLIDRYNKGELSRDEEIIFEAAPSVTFHDYLNRVEITMTLSEEYDLDMITALFKEYICDSEILYFTGHPTIQYHFLKHTA